MFIQKIISHNKIKLNDILNNNIGGLISSGGPLNVYQSKKVKFNENIKNYGHEDTIFWVELKKENFQ